MSKATQNFVREVAVRYTRKRLRHPDPAIGVVMRSASDVAQLFQPILSSSPREKLVVLHLDGRHRIAKSYEIATMGTPTASLAHPREVFLGAILSNATAIILCHCHPSGDPSPSTEDDQITERMCEVGELLGIRVVDHIVIGSEGRYHSYLEAGNLPERSRS